MRNWILLLFLISVFIPGLLGAFALTAEAADLRVTDAAFDGDALPPYVAVFSSRDQLRPTLSPSTRPGLSGGELRTVVAPVLGARTNPQRQVKSGWHKYLPVFYSLLLPGAGEISMGAYKRGVALVAVEVTAWTGYAINHNRGLDSRAEFKAFADRNWSHDRWLREHIATEMLGVDPNSVTFAQVDSFGQSPTYQGVFPAYHPYAAKENETLNYYENIGKYDWFISGWVDWNRAALGNPQQMNTALRDQYRSIRNRSNDQLDRADRFIYLSIAARLFSLVETVMMVRGRSDSDVSRAVTPSKPYSFTARSTGLASGEIAFEYRFR